MNRKIPEALKKIVVLQLKDALMEDRHFELMHYLKGYKDAVSSMLSLDSSGRHPLLTESESVSSSSSSVSHCEEVHKSVNDFTKMLVRNYEGGAFVGESSNNLSRCQDMITDAMHSFPDDIDEVIECAKDVYNYEQHHMHQEWKDSQDEL